MRLLSLFRPVCGSFGRTRPRIHSISIHHRLSQRCSGQIRNCSCQTLPFTISNLIWNGISAPVRNRMEFLRQFHYASFLRLVLMALPPIPINQRTDYWFGWSLRGRDDGDKSRLRFQMRMPAAVDSKMYIHLPPQWKLFSDDSIVNQVATPPGQPVFNPLQPRTAGEVANPSGDFRENWWVLEVGRKITCPVRACP